MRVYAISVFVLFRLLGVCHEINVCFRSHFHGRPTNPWVTKNYKFIIHDRTVFLPNVSSFYSFLWLIWEFGRKLLSVPWIWICNSSYLFLFVWAWISTYLPFSICEIRPKLKGKRVRNCYAVACHYTQSYAITVFTLSQWSHYNFVFVVTGKRSLSTSKSLRVPRACEVMDLLTGILNKEFISIHFILFNIYNLIFSYKYKTVRKLLYCEFTSLWPLINIFSYYLFIVTSYERLTYISEL